MAIILKGKPVADAIDEKTRESVLKLSQSGIIPTLSLFKVGKRDSDLSYEKGIDKKAALLGIKVEKHCFEEDVTEEDLYMELAKANEDPSISGILVFRPLPKRFDDEKLRNFILPSKDVDGCGDMSLSGVFTGKDIGFAPCTAQAAIALLDHYQIDLCGKNVVVIGRSLVIGRPFAMMALKRNATVTICHTKTENIEAITKNADILLCASGVMESIDHRYLKEGQVVLDVGISFNEKKNKLCGDVLFEEAEPLVAAITPVPGGIGAITTSVLLSHVVR